MLYAALSLLLLAIAFVLLSVSYRQCLRTRRAMFIVYTHQIAARNAVQKTRMELQETRDRAKLLETTVSGSTTAVEKVHKAISSTTFGLIDLFSTDDEFRQSVRRVRTTHDQTSQQVYRSVRTTNKALRILADTVISGRVGRRSASDKANTKKLPPSDKP